MSRIIRPHPVEQLVNAYLKRFANTSNTRGKKQIIEKAAKMIGVVLHNPCCPPAEEVIFGLTEDFFLIQLQSLLNGIDERKWKSSLERAKTALENAINNPCCQDCPSVNVSVELPELAGRDNMDISYCGAFANASGDNEPNLAEYVAGEMNASKPPTMTGTFTFDNDARTVTYIGGVCEECENLDEFNVIITAG